MKNKRYAQLLSVPILVFILLYSLKGAAMSALFGTEVVLFSPMEGKITYKSEPASNAKIAVRLYWKDEIGEETIFHANERGEFSIPMRKEKVRIPSLAEFVVTQKITVSFKNEEFVIWYKSTNDAENDEYGGLGGYLQNLRCELTEESERQEDFDGLFGTSCKWDSVIKKGDK